MLNPALPALSELMERLAASRQRGLLLVHAPQGSTASLLEWPSSSAVFSNRPGQRALKSYRQALGLNYPCVVIDCRDEINADAIAALCGTIVAGGVLVLLLPQDLTPFLKRLVRMRPEGASSEVRLTAEAVPGRDMPPLPEPLPFEQLSAEQTQVLDQLEAHLRVPQPALLHAPRGRGKSTLLGYLCAKAVAKQRRVFVSAPSKHQVRTLFQHAEAALGADVPPPSFIAPDALIANAQPGPDDVLIVDEAASLPRHMLEQIVALYPQVKMATTTDGYEGCGQGFVLQFCADLRARFSSFCTLSLARPQRWNENCPLEQWLNTALLLPHTSDREVANAPSGPLHYSYVHASELTNTSLHQCFQLLLDAHYQTTPNDLKMLLDDPTHNLLLQRRGETLVGVAWLADEGQLSAPLSEAVYRGTRRPAGNLLAQSLAYYLRDQQAAQAKLVRVVRIAVAPEHQRTELGSRLLRVCVEQADAYGADAIGTSFGLSPELARFWQRSGFAPVRVGSKRDTVSGRYSALFVRPLTASWSDKVDRWAELLRYHLEPLLLQVSLPVAVVEALAGNDTALAPPADYRDFAWHVIADFAQGYLDFASVQPVLARALTAYPAAPSLLLHAANSQRSLTEDAKQMGFHGRKDYVQTLRQLSDQLLKRAR